MGNCPPFFRYKYYEKYNGIAIMTSLLEFVTSIDFGEEVQVTENKKDVVVKSKRRDATKDRFVNILQKKNVRFTDKKSSKSSAGVIQIDGISGDIVFKPLKAKGAGGVSFEKELMVDLEQFFDGADLKDIQNKSIIEAIQKTLKISQSDKWQVVHEGSKNQKRSLAFNGTTFNISNNTGNVLSDITIRKNQKEYYLSLKMSASYYILNGAIKQFFLSDSTRTKAYEFFGLNGTAMAGFGSKYLAATKAPKYNTVKKNLEELLKKAYGTGITVVHKKSESNFYVFNIGPEGSKVSINGNLTAANYRYPEKGVRKYAAIVFSAMINNYEYKTVVEFRGTTGGDTEPTYLRINLQKR